MKKKNNPNRFASLAENPSEIAAENYQEKKQTHDIFDILWQGLVCSEEDKQRYRTALYHVWGAVAAAEHGDVRGVSDPRQGSQHISKMNSSQQGECREFVRHLIKKYKGNISHIAADVTMWSQDFTLPHEKDKTRAADKIQRALDRDAYITDIRQAIGMACYENKKAAAAEKAPAAAPVERAKTAKDYFADGMVAYIEGDNALMEENFRAAANRFHAEAAWKMWQLLDERAKAQPDLQREALHYLDIASHGCYWLAVPQIRKLHRQDPAITTPYFEELHNAATQPNATSEAMDRLGSYYYHTLCSPGKAEYWYKQAIAKDENVNARVNLYTLYRENDTGFNISESQSEEYYAYIKAHAAPTSYAAYELRGVEVLLHAPGQNAGGGSSAQLFEYMRSLVQQGNELAMSHYNTQRMYAIATNRIDLVPKAEIRTVLKEFVDRAGYLKGSKGEDERERIDCRNTNDFTIATIKAQQDDSILAILNACSQQGDPKYKQYWADYGHSLQEGEAYKVDIVERQALQTQAADCFKAVCGGGWKVACLEDFTMRDDNTIQASTAKDLSPHLLHKLREEGLGVVQEEGVTHIRPTPLREFIHACNRISRTPDSQVGGTDATDKGLPEKGQKIGR